MPLGATILIHSPALNRTALFHTSDARLLNLSRNGTGTNPCNCICIILKEAQKYRHKPNKRTAMPHTGQLNKFFCEPAFVLYSARLCHSLLRSVRYLASGCTFLIVNHCTNSLQFFSLFKTSQIGLPCYLSKL